MATFVKDVLSPGTYKAGDKVVTVTADDLKKFVSTFGSMKASGLRVPVPWEHPATDDDEGYPIHEADPRLKERDMAKHNAGWVDDLFIGNDGTLNARVDIRLEDEAKRVKDVGSFVSPQFGPWKDPAGTDWGTAITHLALTNRPVNTNQKMEFVPVDVAEVAAPVRMSLLDIVKPEEQLQLSAATTHQNGMQSFVKEKSKAHRGLHAEFEKHGIPQRILPHPDGAGYHNTHMIGSPEHKVSDGHKALTAKGFKHMGGNAYRSPKGHQFTLTDHKHGCCVRAVPTSVVRFSQIQFSESKVTEDETNDDSNVPDKKKPPEAPVEKPDEQPPETPPVLPTDDGGAKAKVDALRNSLAGFGIVLPDGIKLSGDIDTIIAAVASAQAAKKIAEADGDDADPNDGIHEEPATVAMSQNANTVQMSQIKALEGEVTSGHRREYKRRIDALLTSGRIDKPTQEKLSNLVGLYQFSASGVSGNEKLDALLEDRESLPEGAVWTPEQKAVAATQMSAGVQEVPENKKFFSKTGDGMSDEDVDRIVGELHPQFRKAAK